MPTIPEIAGERLERGAVKILSRRSPELLTLVQRYSVAWVFQNQLLDPEEEGEFIAGKKFRGQMGSFYGFLWPPTMSSMDGTTLKKAPFPASRHRTGQYAWSCFEKASFSLLDDAAIALGTSELVYAHLL